MLSTNDTLEIVTEKISTEGSAIAHKDGLSIFVPFAAPNEKLKIRLCEIKKNYARAQIVDIIEPGKDRVKPVCPLYEKCGGCNTMHLSYQCQLDSKVSNIKEAISRQNIELDFPINIHPSSPFEYRNRAQFHKYTDSSAAYSSRYSNSLIPVQNCPILVPELSLWLSTKPRIHKERENIFASSGKVFREGTEAKVNIRNKEFSFDVNGFFQSNIQMLEELIPYAIEGTGGKAVADLYCGTGLFASFLSSSFDSLVCVEQDRRSLSYASKNLQSSENHNASFALSSIEDWTKSQKAKSQFDYVLLDPPRAGLSNTVKKWIIENKTKVFGYVSCNPISLVKDMTSFVNNAYTIESIELFDFYPQTAHMEAYVRFFRKKV